jgi:hypothetical protein
MKSCTCYALRAVDCTCLPAKYDEIYEIYTTPEQEPVAWLHTKIEGVAVPHRPADLDKHPDRWEALYKTPPSCPTCKALSRTVMLDQTSHDTTPPQRTWVGLTEDEAIELLPAGDWEIESTLEFAQAIEAKLRERNT